MALMITPGLTACGGEVSPSSTSLAGSLSAPAAPTLDPAAVKGQVTPLLNQLWQAYKARYIQADGRVRDPQRKDDPTTSEGQSYALLRAFWQDDRATFDAVLNWSVSNLQLPRGDSLFAYLWGKSPDNAWKVLDQHAASDADQDIAFALLMASRKWNEPRYQSLSLAIMSDIWDKLVVVLNNRPYLTAGDWAAALPHPVLNPSYFSPYEYRMFAQVDPNKNHYWLAVVDTSYEVIKGCTTARLDLSMPGKLPPDWCAIDKTSAELVSAVEQNKSFDTNFGYDAFRTVWRLALDYRWYGEKRAYDYLQSLTGLREEWRTKGTLAAVHDHAGQPAGNSEDLGVLAGSVLPLLNLFEPAQADRLVSTKLLPRLESTNRGDDPDPAHSDASQARTYYAQNWVWFGLALYTDKLSPAA